MVEKSKVLLLLYVILSLVLIILLGISLFSKNTVHNGTVIILYILSILLILISNILLFTYSTGVWIAFGGFLYIVAITMLIAAVGYSDKKNGYSSHKGWKISTYFYLSILIPVMIYMHYVYYKFKNNIENSDTNNETNYTNDGTNDIVYGTVVP